MLRSSGVTTVALLALALVAAGGTYWPQAARAQDASTLPSTLTVDTSTAFTGQVLQFSYSASPSMAAPSASITNAVVDFGDGQTVDGGSAGPAQTVSGTTVHSYSDPGTYTVTFQALAADGESGSATATVTVMPRPQPSAVLLQTSTAAAQVGQPVTFSVVTSGAATVAAAGSATLRIDYGDGSSETLSSPDSTVSHAYSSAGSYPVLLTVLDSSGQVIAATSTVVQVGPD